MNEVVPFVDKTTAIKYELDLHDADHSDDYRAKKLLDWIEQYWFIEGKIPSLEVAKNRGVDPDTFETWITSRPFRKELRERGLPINDGSNDFGDGFIVLTEQQMAAVEIFTDLNDNRSYKVKLSELGIETKTWAKWLTDPNFATFLNARTELQVKNHQHEANLALMDSVRAGDLASIKYYNEFVGRFGGNKGLSSLDPGWLIQNMVEVLQEETRDIIKHDPELMKRIGDRLMGLIARVAAETSMNSGGK